MDDKLSMIFWHKYSAADSHFCLLFVICYRENTPSNGTPNADLNDLFCIGIFFVKSAGLKFKTLNTNDF